MLVIIVEGKIKEFSTKEEFIDAVKEEQGIEVVIEDIGTTYMRYYPRGTEDSWCEFGEGVGVYQCVEKNSKGAFEVWIV